MPTSDGSSRVVEAILETNIVSFEVVAGSYSRRATVLTVGDSTLLLGDHADPTGVARMIARFQTSGALPAAGARLLDDVRLAASAS